MMGKVQIRLWTTPSMHYSLKLSSPSPPSSHPFPVLQALTTASAIYESKYPTFFRLMSDAIETMKNEQKEQSKAHLQNMQFFS